MPEISITFYDADLTLSFSVNHPDQSMCLERTVAFLKSLPKQDMDGRAEGPPKEESMPKE